jgi:hypothetical protein
VTDGVATPGNGTGAAGDNADERNDRTDNEARGAGEKNGKKNGTVPVQATSATPRINLTPDTLVITDPELEFLRRLAPLVDTPRAAKRLLNTYRLVRVSVPDVPEYLREKRYETVLVLLALITGSPGLTEPMVRSLLASSATDLPSFLQQLDRASTDDAARDWARLSERMAEIPAGSVTSAKLRRWLPAVSRFSFQPGLAATVEKISRVARGPVAADRRTPASRPLEIRRPEN